MNRKLQLLLLNLILFSPLLSFGQSNDLNWLLGNRSIEFHKTTKEPEPGSGTAPLLGPAAVAENPVTGSILFYTDGVNVYDATNQLMPNGTGLSADITLNQPVVIGQMPGEPSRYYIFTNTAGGVVEASIVDMSVQGNAAVVPLGDVISTNAPVPGLLNQSDGMITIPHANGTDFWLVTHTSGSTTYNVTQVTPGGFIINSFSLIGLIQEVGNFSYNPATNQIAVAPSETNRNIEILNFDPASGAISLEADLPLTSTTSTQGIYDIEWHPDGTSLFISGLNSTGQPDLLQYDLANIAQPPPTSLITPVSILPQPNTATGSFGLKLGPDGNIYHLYGQGGQILMGMIDIPDDPADPITYDPSAVNGNFTIRQFPSFLPSPPTTTIDFTFDPPCMNVPTQFFPTVSQPVDSLIWLVDGAEMSKQWSPINTFEEAGSFNVQVIAYAGGQEVATATKVVDVPNTDVQVTLDPEITGCHEEFKFPIIQPPAGVPKCGEPGGSCLQVTAQIQGSGNIQWFGPDGPVVGGTTATIEPERPGYYWITVTEPGGCTFSAGILVKEYDTQDPRAFVWYFGNQAGLDFNPLVQQPTPGQMEDVSGDNAMNAPEGTATISDRNGNPIFYTDGASVWLAGNPTPITTNLGGSPNTTQGVLIMPVAGDETLFYIFTTQEMSTGGYELRYALFDRKLDPVNGLGDIVDPTPADPLDQPSTVLYTRSTERILGVDTWVITHEFGTNTFRAYQVSANGIGEPVISNIGADHTILTTTSGEGYMAYAGGRLAVVYTDNTGSWLQVFDFDSATGEVTNPRPPVAIPGPGTQAYGVAISPGGERIFVTTLGDNTIHEFEYNTGTEEYSYLNPVNNGPTAQPGAIVPGLGGLYVAVQGQNTLGLINVNTTAGTSSDFNPQGTIPFAGQSTLGLPNFVQTTGTPIMEPGLTISNACEGGEVSFIANGKDPLIDQFDWFFDDGTEMIDAGPEVTKTYATAGTYNVKVVVYNKCMPKIPLGSPGYPGGGEAFFDQDFEVNPIPLSPLMLDGQLPIICGDTPLVLKGYDDGDPDFPGQLTYQWSNGETVADLSTTTPGTYSVTVTSTRTTCTNSAQVTLNPYFATLDLGPDLDLCEGQPQTLQAGFDTRATYEWSIDGVVQPNQTNPNEYIFNQALTSPPRQTFVLSVRMFDQRCAQTDEVNIVVNQTPRFTFTTIDDTDCGPGLDNGEINLNITAPLGSPLSYTVSSPTALIGSGVNVSAPANPTFVSLPGDVYTIAVSDQISGCGISSVASVDNAALAFTPTPIPGCHPDMAIDVEITAGSGPFNYSVLDQNGSTVIAGTGAAPNFDTSPLGQIQDGDYVVRLSEPSTGCVSSETVTMTANAPYEVLINPLNICSNQNQVEMQFLGTSPATDGVPSWSTAPSNGVTSFTGNFATLANGTWNVTVNVSGPSACPGTATRTVSISSLNVSIQDPPSVCVDPISLSATLSDPTATGTYDWASNGTPFTSGNPILVPSTENGRNMVVTFTNAANGCSYNSNPFPVNIVTPFTVTLVAPPVVCEDTDFDLVATPSRPGVTQFIWTFNGTQIPENGSVITEDRGGTYSVIGTLSGCQSPPATTTILTNPKPSVDLGSLKRICPHPAAPDELESTTLDPQADFAGYEWYTVDGAGLEEPLNNTSRTHEAVFQGTYRLRVTDAIGCTATDDVEVVEECDPVITGPNAFRPGGVNTVFSLFTFFIADEDFEILIFNRWGELVYQSTDREFAWNGRYKGNGAQLLPAGTYAYVVKYRSQYFPDQGIKEKRGGVVLLQ